MAQYAVLLYAEDSADLIVGCLRAGPPGRYVLQAAIASLYAGACLRNTAE
jgi:predicted RNA polymerase sigma factor